MIKFLLKKLYFTPVGRFLSQLFNPVWRSFKRPRMLWGHRNSTGEWHANTRISDTVFFYHPENIFIENNVFVWHYTILDGTGGLKIGQGSQVGAWVGIFTHSSHIAIRLYGNHYIQVPENKKIAFDIAPVVIGKFVFVGAGAKILPGVTIGDGAIISANSMIIKDVQPFQIVAGNPAKVIGDSRKLDEKYLAEHVDLRTWYEEW